MRKVFVGSILLVLAALSAVAAPPPHLELARLTASMPQLIGKSVSTSGCVLVNVHGTAIKPCAQRGAWVLVLDPKGLVPEAFAKLKVDYSHLVYANFRGTVVKEHVSWPRSEERFFLRLTSVVNGRVYEP
jgi:hypothetical protein